MKWTDCVKELLLRQSRPLWCIWCRFFLSCCWNFLWRSWKFAWADVLLCAADFLQFSAAATKPPQKRKRSSESRPSKPSHSPGDETGSCNQNGWTVRWQMYCCTSNSHSQSCKRERAVNSLPVLEPWVHTFAAIKTQPHLHICESLF